MILTLSENKKQKEKHLTEIFIQSTVACSCVKHYIQSENVVFFFPDDKASVFIPAVEY